MKKIFLSVFAVMLALCLVGCNNKKLRSGTESDTEQQKRTAHSFVSSADVENKSESTDIISQSSKELDSEVSDNANKSSKAAVSADSKIYSDKSNAVVSSSEQSTREEYIDWHGIYMYDDGNLGEIYSIDYVENGIVSGFYVYGISSGEYRVRDFVWNIESVNVSTEPFQTGTDKIYFNRYSGGITADYPEGWWENRDYKYICQPDEANLYITHPYFPGNSQSANSEQTEEKQEDVRQPFYGIWVSASKDKAECDTTADGLRNKGYSAGVYETTDWSNLNSEPWYVVSAGEYLSETEANAALQNVVAAGYDGAYIKYTGDWIG